MRVAHYAASMGPQSASRRLQLALRDAGVDAWSVVREGACDDIRSLPQSMWGRYGRKAARKLEHLVLKHVCGLPDDALWNTASFGTPVTAASFGNPDILHLHWIAAGAIGLASLARLPMPIIWTMHDTWPFTAGCHIREGCERYRSGCAGCHFLPLNLPFDYAAHQFRVRRKAYAALDFVAVSPSRSYQEKARASALLRDVEVYCIPNGIDTAVFRPLDKDTARSLLGLPDSGLLVLTGAVTVDERHKGLDLALDALHRVASAGIEFSHVSFGGGRLPGGDESATRPFPSINLGRLSDHITLVLAYAAADVFVCPSREESFSQTTLESMACGTPVAAFGVGGIPDMVEHGVSGWVAPPEDVEALAEGLALLLGDAVSRKRMGAAARETVEQEFAARIVARRYCELYDYILRQGMKRHGSD